MKAGILREKIEIYSYQEIQTEYGNTKKEWSLHYTTRAQVRYNSGSKVVQTEEQFWPRNRTFIVRYYVPVTEPMRIKYDNKFWQIISIAPDRYYNDKVIIAEMINE